MRKFPKVFNRMILAGIIISLIMMIGLEGESESVNVLEPLYPIAGYTDEMNGVKYTWDGNTCIAAGVSAGYSQSRIYFSKNELPAGLIPGYAYRVACVTTDQNLRFSIVFYSGGEQLKTLYFVNDSVFAVPEEAEGCLIRAWVNKDVTVNGTLSFQLFYEAPDKQVIINETNYSNTFTTEHYENTYSIECAPVIEANTDYYLCSTGDQTDMTGAIQSMLNIMGICRLGPGDYYVTGIEIPNNGMLVGSGNTTRIILNENVENGYAVRLKSYGCVKDVQIIGSEKTLNPELPLGRRHGILFEGTADNKEDSLTYYRSTIENCTISGFDGGGITCCNTGLSPASSLLVSNCHIFQCGAGINVSYYSEYHRWTNISVMRCYYGCVCNGGNNNFCNCDFSENVIGLLIDNSAGQSNNNSHGTFDACSFNHSNHNEGTAIRILGAYAGEIFNGCQIFYGGIEIENSSGIRFTGANMGRQVPIAVKDSSAVIFSDCTVWSSEESPLEQSNNKTLRFIDCCQRNGEPYSPEKQQGGE